MGRTLLPNLVSYIAPYEAQMLLNFSWASKAEDFASYYFRDDRLDSVFTLDYLAQR